VFGGTAAVEAMGDPKKTVAYDMRDASDTHNNTCSKTNRRERDEVLHSRRAEAARLNALRTRFPGRLISVGPPLGLERS